MPGLGSCCPPKKLTPSVAQVASPLTEAMTGKSDTTFTGTPKALHLNENWHLFDPEDWIRESSLIEVFPSLEGTEAEAKDGDAPGSLHLLRYCDFPSRLILRMGVYYYSYQWRHRGPQWSHPDATTTMAGLLGAGIRPIAALRRWWTRATIWNAGWHCSSCFATVAEMGFKMNSLSHQGWSHPFCRELPALTDRVRRGRDLSGRAGENYDRVEGNRDLPMYILEQCEKRASFKCMMNRDGEDAGFEDWGSATRSGET
ncbi:glycosyltransferase family 17 protein [Dothistroma septosporum NZE10]|uniref:Glycosyltransferase family 17 protein n=1 Tax=Dothistroma septosporum (strain NZE10 / CBS 128990) TaxID=675120 RepID=N1PWW7_DOTSN|nr:glycosyltransferase family 17 protein [Dothistroma septosporum NZE10]